jgi:hypothetical protein
MSNNTRSTLVYFLLALMFIGSAVLLAYQVRFLLKERQDPTTPFLSGLEPPEEMAKNYNKKEQEVRSSIHQTFARTAAFQPIATQVPRPTPTPRPLPTPTPVPIAKNWKINFVLKNSASLWKYDGTVHIVRPGDIMQDKAFGDFTIQELKPDPSSPQVIVKHLPTQKIGSITDVR